MLSWKADPISDESLIKVQYLYFRRQWKSAANRVFTVAPSQSEQPYLAAPSSLYSSNDAGATDNASAGTTLLNPPVSDGQ